MRPFRYWQLSITLKSKNSTTKSSYTNNTKLTMRPTLAIFFFLTMAVARAGEGQQLATVTVTATIKSGTLESAIRELRKVTRVPFAYDKQLLNAYHVDTYTFLREPLEKV